MGGLLVNDYIFDLTSASVCLYVLVARIMECLRGCIVRCIEPELFMELHITRNLYYYYAWCHGTLDVLQGIQLE